MIRVMNAVTSQRKNEEIVSYNPATQAEVGRASQMSSADVNAAVERSRAVFENWKITSFAERSRLVMRTRDVVLTEMEEIAHLVSAESGKPFSAR